MDTDFIYGVIACFVFIVIIGGVETLIRKYKK